MMLKIHDISEYIKIENSYLKLFHNIPVDCSSGLVFWTGQSEIEKACDLLFEKAEILDYRYDIHDRTVEGLLILPLYGSMPTGQPVSRLF